MSRNDIFEVFRDAEGHYRWWLKVRGHGVVAVSEPHASKEDALDSILGLSAWIENARIRFDCQEMNTGVSDRPRV
jgi:uncharacterized protein YegP (UPF0339 family)